jgi:succinate dehydrogenase/fumarate reductase flavoprotein subunit
MAFNPPHLLRCDVLVIGSGGAGLTAAIEARKRGAEVIVVSKSRTGVGNNTFISKGVFAAATGFPDSRDAPEVHVRDTLKGGRFVNDIGLLEVVAENVGERIDFLRECGVRFSERDGILSVTQAPGHSYPRHVRGEHQSGRDFVLPQKEHARHMGVRFADRVFVTRLHERGGRFAFATGITAQGEFLAISAKCAVLATGGFAQVFLRTNNAAGMTGDGLALAFDLGIPVKDVEFVQFYPTAMGDRGTRVLLYEAFVFRAGAVLRNSRGEDIRDRHGFRDAKGMTRDRLTRAIMLEILAGRDVDGGVLMDMSPVSQARMNGLSHLLPARAASQQKAFRVAPTAHFCMGGVVANPQAETRLKGLYAAGEVCGGVHGANRLAGNALAEVFALGGIAGSQAAAAATAMDPPQCEPHELEAEKTRLESLISPGDRQPQELRRALKALMWHRVGIIRNADDLSTALTQLHDLRKDLPRLHIRNVRELIRSLELRNMLTVSEMVCRAALLRTESRGAHFRSDYPEEDNKNWLRNITVRKAGAQMALQTVAPPQTDQFLQDRA